MDERNYAKIEWFDEYRTGSIMLAYPAEWQASEFFARLNNHAAEKARQWDNDGFPLEGRPMTWLDYFFRDGTLDMPADIEWLASNIQFTLNMDAPILKENE